MILTADFHTHILPGIDDGSRSVEESIQLICEERAQEVRNILLTPHYHPQQMCPDDFLKKRKQSIDLLTAALAKETNIPQLILGAEVYFSPGMHCWEQLDQLTLGSTKHILIEMPTYKWTDSIYNELTSIHEKRGITPILAHIERYFSPFHTQKMLQRLSDLPILLQINTSFLLNKGTQNTAIRLIKDKKVHLLGSDCHRISWRQPTMLQARNILLKHTDSQTQAFLSYMEHAVLQE